MNDNCRLCNANLIDNRGRLAHTKLIFAPPKHGSNEKNVFGRLSDLGLTLTQSGDKSFRCCLKCDTVIKKLESVLPCFRKWEEDENGSVALAAAASAAAAATTTTTASSSTTPSVASQSPAPSSPPPMHGLSTSVAEKRPRVTPSKTQRALKKIHVKDLKITCNLAVRYYLLAGSPRTKELS